MRSVLAIVMLCAGCAGARSISAEQGPERLGAVAHQVEIPSGSLMLSGTFELPARASNERVPVFVFVHGSGPHSRDQAVAGQLNMRFGFEFPVFAHLADALVGHGFAIVRYDKRTCGRFNGCAKNAYPRPGPELTVHAFSEDVLAAVRWLATRREIDPSRVYVLGHSQGASLVPSLLGENPAIAGGVMLAPPHRPIDALIELQLDESERMLTELMMPAAARREALAGLQETVADLRAVREGTFHGTSVGGASVTFWKSWFGVSDEAPDRAAEIAQPLLLIGGSRDFNVPPAELDRWSQSLRTKPGRSDVQKIACLTHAMTCVPEAALKDLLPEQLGRDLHPEVAQRIAKFFENPSAKEATSGTSHR